MKAPIVEIFSSFQGEGLWIGRRQIFIRFSGCNLTCDYCDTQQSQSESSGTLMTVDEILNKIEVLASSDLHSISFTGGEPLLYVDFINEIIKNIKSSNKFQKSNLRFMLETNGTLPKSLAKLDGINCVSMDVKLPEHFKDDWNNDIFENEIKSLNLLIEHKTNVYLKLVVLPLSKPSTIKGVSKRIFDEISKNNSYIVNDEFKLDILCIIQPSSPLMHWKNQTTKFFEFSEIIAQYMGVAVIPQTHKLLNIE